MQRPHFSAALLAFSVLGSATAQVTIPINPKATYLRVATNDPGVQPAPAIPLGALGLNPGQWVQIAATGGYSINGSADTNRNLLCIFSSSPSLAIPGTSPRVLGAVSTGPAWATPPVTSPFAATDVVEDFVVARTSWQTSTLVQVPAGATHLFLTAFNPTASSSAYGINADPNGDFAAVFTPANPSTLQGTAEHAELRTGVNAATTATPDVKPASPFATVSVDVAQRYGGFQNVIFLVAANVHTTGAPGPVGPLPGFHVGTDFILVQTGVMSTAPGQWSFFVPPGFAGNTIVTQGFFLSDYARNGLLMSTEAHRIELQ